LLQYRGKGGMAAQAPVHIRTEKTRGAAIALIRRAAHYRAQTKGDVRPHPTQGESMTTRHTTYAARAPALEALRVNTIVGRARCRLSQEDLADRAGVSRPTISRIERGTSSDVGLDTIERIAHALDVSVAELFILPVQSGLDDDELARRATAADAEFVDAEALLDAVDEAVGAKLERYSRAGRPPLAR
jgi:transcriptional regulator with XRE-family HTH domain